jgi:hypothetical protein
MLAYVLALLVGIGSLAMYMAAFFFPEVHRKSDFIWSAVGLFYALVLWVCAGRITGGVLLGQTASIALLGWFGWQTVTLRRERALPEDKTEISPQVQEKIQGFSLTELGQKLQQQVSGLFKKKQPDTPTPQSSQATVKPATETKTAPTESTATVETATPEVAETSDIAPAPETTADAKDGSNVVTIVDSRNSPTETGPEETATTEAIAPETKVDEPAADGAEMSETPELVRPNPPAPELVEAAQQTPSDAPEAAVPVEEIAPDAELAPPAEPPDAREPQTRENPPEV